LWPSVVVTHSSGNLSASLELQPWPSLPGDRTKMFGYQHLKNLRRARTDGNWWVRWDQPGARMTLTFRGEPDTEVFVADAPGGPDIPIMPMIIVHRQCITTVFRAEHRFEALATAPPRQP
jgi:hypothetical protein